MECPYPETRGWFESIHELNFARSNRVQRCPEVVRLYHADAPVRLMLPDSDAVVAGARARVAQAEAVMALHDHEMRRHAPRRWTMLVREAALFNFFAGDRRSGIRHSVAVLRSAPLSLRTWAVLAAGTFAPSLLIRLWTGRRTRVVT